jgi:hypothetical protein
MSCHSLKEDFRPHFVGIIITKHDHVIYKLDVHFRECTPFDFKLLCYLGSLTPITTPTIDRPRQQDEMISLFKDCAICEIEINLRCRVRHHLMSRMNRDSIYIGMKELLQMKCSDVNDKFT